MRAGAHGAGLTNMVFAPDTASVVEFGLSPQIDRCFGFMAVALGLDYWLVPEISTNLFNAYHVDEDKAAAAVRVVRHIIRQRGLIWLLAARDEL